MTSFDDCKKANTPSPIFGIRKGDMVDAKNDQYEKMIMYPWFTGIEQLEDQLQSQQNAVIIEGKERHVFVCFDGARAAEAAGKMYGERFSQLRFLNCP